MATLAHRYLIVSQFGVTTNVRDLRDLKSKNQLIIDLATSQVSHNDGKVWIDIQSENNELKSTEKVINLMTE